MIFHLRGGGGGGEGGRISELMDGRGCAIWALGSVPKNLIFAKNPTQTFILQDFMLAISERKTGESHQCSIS